MEWSLLGFSETFMIIWFFLREARKNHRALIVGISTPAPIEQLIRLFLRGCFWVVMIVVYMSLRTDLFDGHSLSLSLFACFGIFWVFLVFSLISSYFVYVGMWDEKKEEIKIFLEIRRNAFADYLEQIRKQYGRF